MSSEALQRYLEGVLQIELDLYTQGRTIEKLTSVRNTLCRHAKITVPRRGQPQTEVIDSMLLAGFFCGLLSGIIALVFEWLLADSFFAYIGAIIVAIIYAGGGALAGGVVFGPIIWCVRRKIESKQLDKQLQEDIARYDAEVAKQNHRIQQEKVKRNALDEEIAALKTCYEQTVEDLEEVYSYGVLAPEYQNIYAVSSFYGYLKKGMTYGLSYDVRTADKGAYNIYEEERRLNKIITNTDEILTRLDQVAFRQQELVRGLEEATYQIRQLSGKVTQQIGKISSSVKAIERCQDVIAYQSACSARNLEFLTWVHTVY